MEKSDRIQAIKNGVKATFSKYEWELIAKNRNGWEELGELKEVKRIPVEEVVVEESTEVIKEKITEKVEEKVVIEKITPEKAIIKKELTVEEMKIALKGKSIKFHHRTGDVKIKALYDENTK